MSSQVNFWGQEVSKTPLTFRYRANIPPTYQFWAAQWIIWSNFVWKLKIWKSSYFYPFVNNIAFHTLYFHNSIQKELKIMQNIEKNCLEIRWKLLFCYFFHLFFSKSGYKFGQNSYCCNCLQKILSGGCWGNAILW